jgi:hypothetical protein
MAGLLLLASGGPNRLELTLALVVTAAALFVPAILAATYLLRTVRKRPSQMSVLYMGVAAAAIGAIAGSLFDLTAGIGGALVAVVVVMPGFLLDLSRAAAVKAVGPRFTSLIPVVVSVFAIVFVVPNLVGSRIVSNDTSAIAALVVYHSSQEIFRKENPYQSDPPEYANPNRGSYADLYEVGFPNGNPKLRTHLIDLSMALARGDSATPSPKAGYFFIDIQFGDYTKDFGLCAYPAVFEKTGRKTYIVRRGDGVYYKNTGGAPVRTWPVDLEAEGWVSVSSR